MSLLLAETDLRDLSVRQQTNNVGVLLDLGDGLVDGCGLLVSVLLGVLGEGLVLGAVPVLVESALDLIRQMLSPHSGESAEAARSLDVTNDTNADHRGGLDDGNLLEHLLAMLLGARLLQITQHSSAASLVAKESGQVHGLGSIIFGE